MADGNIDSAALALAAAQALADVQAAAQALAEGQLVAFPTETVYGLGANACNDTATARIFAAKGRPADHPLIVHIASPSGVAHFAAAVPAFAHKLIAAFWPGPLTVILPRRSGVAQAAAGGQSSIGLRCPSHPMALSLLRECQKLGVQGLAAPSANRFGRISPTSAAHVRDEFGAALLVLDGGSCEVGIESAIIDCTRGKPVLLRHGMLSHQQLVAACGEPLLLQEAMLDNTPRAPGTLASHYAPRAKLRLVSEQEALKIQAAKGCALYRLPANAARAAHELFAQLRELDQAGVSEIWVTHPPASPEWDGVRDRLTRAAA